MNTIAELFDRIPLRRALLRRRAFRLLAAGAMSNSGRWGRVLEDLCRAEADVISGRSNGVIRMLRALARRIETEPLGKAIEDLWGPFDASSLVRLREVDRGHWTDRREVAEIFAELGGRRRTPAPSQTSFAPEASVP